jgi:hypothetical protein
MAYLRTDHYGWCGAVLARGENSWILGCANPDHRSKDWDCGHDSRGANDLDVCQACAAPVVHCATWSSCLHDSNHVPRIRALFCGHGLWRNAILACPATTASRKLNRIMDHVTQQRLKDTPLRRLRKVARIIEKLMRRAVSTCSLKLATRTNAQQYPGVQCSWKFQPRPYNIGCKKF